MNLFMKLFAIGGTIGAFYLGGCAASVSRDYADNPYHNRGGYYYYQRDPWQHRYEPYYYRDRGDWRDRKRLEVHVGD